MVPDGLYFIAKGEAYASNSKGTFVYFRLPAGSYFGDTHLLFGIPLSYSLFYEPD